MIRAFAFLLLTTARNRVQSQLKRLRTPRYAIGLVLGVGYFWLVFGRRVFTQPARAASATGSVFEILGPLFVLVTVGGIWLFGGDRSALAFTEAEVSMLLTAPVSRRGLILYKLAQSQIALVINAVIWVFLLRRGNSTLPGVLSAAALWVAFSTLNLHRMGAALVRASHVEYRVAGKRSVVARAVFGTLIALLVLAAFIGPDLIVTAPNDGSSDPLSIVRSVAVMLSGPKMQMATFPFRLVVAPIFTHTVSAWATAMLPALGILLLHVGWVLRSDTAFEEAAALASTERAKMIENARARRSASPTPATGGAEKTLALAPTGRPSIAIIWKNALAFRRTFKPGTTLRLLFISCVVPGFIAWRSGDPARVIVVMAVVMAVMIPILLLQMMRTDLRSDMLHLPFLKSLPLSGAEVVMAEVAPGAVVMAVVQLALLAAAAVAITFTPWKGHVPAGMIAGVAVAALPVLLAFNFMLCTIANGSAVLFPAWHRLGPAAPGGVEVMGQAMLAMIGSGVVFALLLILPAAFGAVAYFALGAIPALAVAATGLVAAMSLLGETYALMLALGRAFERAEPQQVG